MVVKKYEKIKYPIERVFLSDVLPYEIPLIFTNRHFYLSKIMNKTIWDRDELAVFKEYLRCGKDSYKIAFSYNISHKENEFRELAVPHPASQIEVMEFYKKYKELILYYCSRSNFSIRYPCAVAKTKVFKDSGIEKSLNSDHAIIEEKSTKYENLMSFFTYKKYSNIYKFYEHYDYHRAEKKFKILVKADILKCFDSIYTHSMSWAIFGKNLVKKNLEQNKTTFANKFDKLMQKLNHNETNGIIIGPEFCRIFAEIILQTIDRHIEQELLNNERPLKNQTDYQIFRYVDDYFIFCNNGNDKKIIIDTIQQALKKYKLFLNSAKTTEYKKPIITELTIAKERIKIMFNDKLSYRTYGKCQKVENDDEMDINESNEQDNKAKYIKVNSNSLITQYKIIISETGIEYKDILNYTMAIIHKKCKDILEEYAKIINDIKIEKKVSKEVELTKAIIQILEFMYFIYLEYPRVNITIKACTILSVIFKFIRDKPLSHNNKHVIFKCVYDNCCLILKKNQISRYIQLETMYILVALKELGKGYYINEKILRNYLNIKPDSELNYFAIMSILYYVGNKKSYEDLKNDVVMVLKNRLSDNCECDNQKLAEAVFLVLDSISCPYMDKVDKREILQKIGIKDENKQGKIINCVMKNKILFFITWYEMDFKKELDTKRSQEVY